MKNAVNSMNNGELIYNGGWNMGTVDNGGWNMETMDNVGLNMQTVDNGVWNMRREQRLEIKRREYRRERTIKYTG